METERNHENVLKPEASIMSLSITHASKQWFSTGGDAAPPRGHLVMSGDSFGGHHWVGESGEVLLAAASRG